VYFLHFVDKVSIYKGLSNKKISIKPSIISGKRTEWLNL